MALSNRALYALCALNGLLGVGLGAFAAHGVHAPEAKELLRTGATYQLAHAAAGAAVMPASRLASALMGLGALIFALSLDAFAAGAPRWTGMVTPAGGVLMLAGWFVLLVTTAKFSNSAGAEKP
jgi:uncharacterized membrane protein YgdD (TMEM256/DUF423 family)